MLQVNGKNVGSGIGRLSGTAVFTILVERGIEIKNPVQIVFDPG